MQALFRRTRSVIGMECAPGSIRLVEVDSGPRGYRVTRFAIIDHIPDAEGLAMAQVREALEKKGFTADSAAFAISGAEANVRLLSLPSLKKKELRIVVEHDLKHEAGASFEELAYDYRVLGKSGDDTTKHDMVLLVSAPRQRLRSAVDFVNGCGLELSSVTPTPLALASLLAMIEPKRVVGLLHIDGPAGHLVIVSQGCYRLHREIKLDQASAGGEKGEPNLTELSGEVRRTFQYYSQQFRGEKVEGLLLSETSLLGACERLGALPGVVVEPCNLVGLVDLSSLNGEQGEFQAQASALAVPLGLAVGSSAQVNLLPKDLLRQQREMPQASLRAAAALAFALVMLGGFHSVSAGLDNIRAELQAVETEQQALQPKLQALTAAQEQRAYHAARQQFLERARDQTRFFSELLKDLSVLALASIELQSLEISRGPTDWDMTLEGKARGPGLGASLALMDDFHRRIQRSQFLVHAETQLIGERPPGEKTEEEPKGNIRFAMNAGLVLKPLLNCTSR